MIFVLIVLVIIATALAWAGWLLLKRVKSLRSELGASESRAREIGDFLARFSAGIQGEDGVSGAMRGAARHVADQIEAEAVVICEVQEERLSVSGIWIDSSSEFSTDVFADRLRRESLVGSDEGFAAGVAKTGVAELVENAALDSRFEGYSGSLHSVMGVPLLRDGICIGVVCAINRRLRREQAFSTSHFERFKLLAHQVLLVHKIAGAYQEISRRDRIDQELSFVRNLQMSLLPGGVPQWGCFSIVASTRSAKEVDGDFYDFLRIDDDRMLILIGDACGKGIPACMLTAMALSFARSLTDNFTTLTAFLHELNKKLHRDIDGDRFITVGCCLLDKRNSLLEFGRAGHTDMLSFVHNHIRVFSPDGVALGILPDEFAEFESICIALDPGTTVLMFSDGITEATDSAGNEFGMERLTATFRSACECGKSIRGVLDSITRAVSEYEQEQNDDQTLVVIRQTNDDCE